MSSCAWTATVGWRGRGVVEVQWGVEGVTVLRWSARSGRVSQVV